MTALGCPYAAGPACRDCDGGVLGRAGRRGLPALPERGARAMPDLHLPLHARGGRMSDQMPSAEKDALTTDEREALAERLLAAVHGRDGAEFLRREAATPWRNALAQVAEAEHFFATRTRPIPPATTDSIDATEETR